MHKGLIRYGKYRKFLQKELDLEHFIARQLTDTGYISRATVEYLRCLFESDHDVLGLKGQHTAELRRQWGLNSVLRNDDLDLKNREDHRHHAVDAVIAALTNRQMLQRLARGTVEVAHANRETREIEHRQQYAGEGIDEPWTAFRAEVEERVNEINVSHRAERKVAGALHEDTFYGPTSEEGVFVVRKPLESISSNEIALIRDEGVRKVIEARLAEHGIEVGRGNKIDSRKWKQALCDENNPVLLPPSKKRLKRNPNAQGVPIKKVRVYRRELTIQPIRVERDEETYVKPGSTHHLAIYEWESNGKRKRDAVFVTQLEAINRIKRQQQELSRIIEKWKGEGISPQEARRRKRHAMSEIAKEYPVIDRTPPKNHPTIPLDATFVLSLSRNEMVLADWKGEEKLLVFKTAASTQGQIYFAEHTDARRSSEYQKFVANANTLNANKVTVDPLGRIRWAND